ncbi:hypothetical protein [Heyndrickxia ginsengihumi]|uniref:hypothetical protein n=1 Tax=Heyndrickxia ginsengihumi TaxID=363870 RepID=UPI00046EB794|nr:hypothetical protein [Heyndrickxia ginsengihumi]MBE6183652.1 hypothetical protein [Bacillus sp. (in: firmicutes)]MCM3022362.1 hypothetical protein [Heyndrickxia ginsengihumi]
MKYYVAFLFQLMVWSVFTLASWLSKGDRMVFKVITFIVFFYLAFLLAKSIIKSFRRTMIITVSSLSAYGVLQIVLDEMVK